MSKKNYNEVVTMPTIDTKHIDVLDGIRALAVLIVAGFHFWQQSWLQDLIPTNALSSIGIADSNINWLMRTGYELVDLMILLSGFLLFLPYARHMIEGEGLPKIKDFYRRRAARIIPSVYFCIFIIAIFFVSIENNFGGNTSAFLKDFFSHLTFTQTFSKETYIYTKFNAALWTVSVEMAFYLIFPLVAFCFRKKPIITYSAMVLLSQFYIVKYVMPSSDVGMVFNQLPAFFGVYANGMMGAIIFVAIANNLKHNKYTAIFFTGLALACLFFIRYMMKYGLNVTNNIQPWQAQNRFIMSVFFVLFIISCAFSMKWFKFIFANPVAKFLSVISFNFYIWHQYISVKLKEWHIPYWKDPNLTDGKEYFPQQSEGLAWQWKYTITIWVVSLAFAILVTYCVEKPMAKLIMGKYKWQQEWKQKRIVRK